MARTAESALVGSCAPAGSLAKIITVARASARSARKNMVFQGWRGAKSCSPRGGQHRIQYSLCPAVTRCMPRAFPSRINWGLLASLTHRLASGDRQNIADWRERDGAQLTGECRERDDE